MPCVVKLFMMQQQINIEHSVSTIIIKRRHRATDHDELWVYRLIGGVNLLFTIIVIAVVVVVVVMMVVVVVVVVVVVHICGTIVLLDNVAGLVIVYGTIVLLDDAYESDFSSVIIARVSGKGAIFD